MDFFQKRIRFAARLLGRLQYTYKLRATFFVDSMPYFFVIDVNSSYMYYLGRKRHTYLHSTAFIVKLVDMSLCKSFAYYTPGPYPI